jgi:hypothetical protein
MKAFPSPSSIRRQSPHQLYGRTAKHCFDNLSRDFENRASIGKTQQSILLKRRCSWSRTAPTWIKDHVASTDQRTYTIDYCNQQLAGTGWRVTAIGSKSVRVYSDYYCADESVMPALLVEMEYTCDSACAAK